MTPHCLPYHIKCRRSASYIKKRTHTRTCIHAHTRMHIPEHACTHIIRARTRAHTHMHTHTHTHIFLKWSVVSKLGTCNGKYCFGKNSFFVGVRPVSQSGPTNIGYSAPIYIHPIALRSH